MSLTVPKLAIPYIRMSTQEQLKGHSLSRQTDLINEYAAENNMEVDWSSDYIDIGKSAFKGQHLTGEAGMGRFLGAIQAGAIKAGTALLIESLDRLSRLEVKRALSMILSILDYGIEIHTIGASERNIFHKDTDEKDLIIAIILLSRANNESKIKQERLQKAWANKRKIAIEQKKPITKRIPAWLYIENEEFKVHQDRVDIVQRIYDLKIKGVGKEKTAKMFNEEGIDTWGPGNSKAKFWYNSYIDKILHNEAVLGTYKAQKLVDGKKVFVQEVKHYYPQIIDKRTFDLANIKNKITRGRKAAYFSNLFTGLASCKLCGSKMHMLNKGKPPKGGKYLVCSKAKSGLGCEYKTARYDLLESNILSLVNGLDLKKVIDTEQSNELIEEKEELELQISNLKKIVSKLKNTLTDIESDPDIDRIPLSIIKSLNKNEDELADFKEQYQDLSNSIVHSNVKDKEFILLIDEINSDNYELRSKVNLELKTILTSIKIEVHGSYNNKLTEVELTFLGGYRYILLINKTFSEIKESKVLIIATGYKHGPARRFRELVVKGINQIDFFDDENGTFKSVKDYKIKYMLDGNDYKARNPDWDK